MKLIVIIIEHKHDEEAHVFSSEEAASTKVVQIIRDTLAHYEEDQRELFGEPDELKIEEPIPLEEALSIFEDRISAQFPVYFKVFKTTLDGAEAENPES